MLIARLIADPEGLLTRIEQVKRALDADSAPIAASAKQVPEGVLVEIHTSGAKKSRFRSVVEEAFPVYDGLIADDDIAVPALFVSDMDSTMIGQECIDELADYAGLKNKIADITERAMQGELDFESALRERVRLLKGLDEGAIQRCLDERIEPTPGAKTLVQTLKAKGCRSVLVTGGFHHFADPVAENIGFDRVVGNRLQVADGALTGELDGPVVDSSVKKSVLNTEMLQFKLGSRSLAAGDGANDIPMLEAADYGAAYRAKPKARAAANCWVDRGNLTSLLVLLGIPRTDWIA